MIEMKIKGKRIVRKNILVDGGDFMVTIDDEFDRKKGARHNIFHVERIFRILFKQAFKKAWTQFMKYLVFDYLIGNQERHQDNWGVLSPGGKYRFPKLAPAYDNGSSLGREIRETDIPAYLKDKTRLDAYIRRGKPHMRWSDDGMHLEHLTFIDFFTRLVKKNPAIKNIIEELTAFRNPEIVNLLADVPPTILANQTCAVTEQRVALVQQMVCRRRDILRQLFL